MIKLYCKKIEGDEIINKKKLKSKKSACKMFAVVQNHG